MSTSSSVSGLGTKLGMNLEKGLNIKSVCSMLITNNGFGIGSVMVIFENIFNFKIY